MYTYLFDAEGNKMRNTFISLTFIFIMIHHALLHQYMYTTIPLAVTLTNFITGSHNIVYSQF